MGRILCDSHSLAVNKSLSHFSVHFFLVCFDSYFTAGTPYEGGYFHVKFNFTDDFPAAPPKCTSRDMLNKAVFSPCCL